jgi:hypothetical protein
MDQITVKDLLPVMAGAMALAGGKFAFINGRLQEAVTYEGRQNVVNWLLRVCGLIFSLLGFGSVLIFHNFALPAIAFLIPIMFSIILALRRTGPIGRGEVLYLCFLCCYFTFMIIAWITLYLFDQVIKALSS